MLLHDNPDPGGGTQAAGLEQVVARFKQVKKVGRDNWMAFCQSHDDGAKSRRRSLSLRIVRDGEPKILAKCLAGCATETAVVAAGLTMADLFEHFERKAPRGSARTPVETYSYRDATGELRYQALRYDPKDFRLRRPDPASPHTWIWNLKGVEPLLYRLDQLRDQQMVCLTEGEKDADALAVFKLAATTNHGGSDQWTDAHTAQLAALKPEMVVIFEDHDVAGRKRTSKVAPALMAAGLEVKVITAAELGGLPEKGDISDWLAAGHTRDELLAAPSSVRRTNSPDFEACIGPGRGGGFGAARAFPSPSNSRSGSAPTRSPARPAHCTSHDLYITRSVRRQPWVMPLRSGSATMSPVQAAGGQV